MQTENRLFDDLARMANGALNTLSGLREEIETRVRERVERMLSDMDVVPREEFDAVREMAATARSEQEALSAKVAELERRLDEVAGTTGPATARAATPRRKRAAARTAGAGSAGPTKPASPRRRTTRATPTGE